MTENDVKATMMTNDVDIERCLTQLGVERHQIIPTNTVQRVLRQKTELNQFRNEINNIFPLEWFDDGDRDAEFFTECMEGECSLIIAPQHRMTQQITLLGSLFAHRVRLSTRLIATTIS